jgi:hypothetical protein
MIEGEIVLEAIAPRWLAGTVTMGFFGNYRELLSLAGDRFGRWRPKMESSTGNARPAKNSLTDLGK